MRKGITSRDCRGFTLVELLIVVAILAVLIGLMFAAVQRVRESASRLACANNLKQLGMAFEQYHDKNGTLPPGNLSPVSLWAGQSWGTYLLPYIGQDTIFSRYDFNSFSKGNIYFNPNNQGLLSGVVIPEFRCASSPLDVWGSQEGVPGRYMLSSYVGICGSIRSECIISTGYPGIKKSIGGALLDVIETPPGFKNGFRVSHNDIGDGLSSTIIVAEQTDWCLRWDEGKSMPTKVNCQAAYHNPPQQSYPLTMGPCCFDTMNQGGTIHLTTVRSPIGTKSATAYGSEPPFPFTPIQSTHVGNGANVLFCDGSVRYLLSDLGIDTLYSLADRNDGNAITEDF